MDRDHIIVEEDHAEDRSHHCYNWNMSGTHRTFTIHFSANGEVEIPHLLREELDIREGMRAIVYREGDVIVLKPIAPSHIKNLRGSLKGSGLLRALVGGRKRERDLK